LHPARPRRVERPPEIQGVGDGIEHRFRRYVRFAGMQRGRQLNRVGSQIGSELKPIDDGPIRIGVADGARRQLLQRGREDSNLHELRFEGANPAQIADEIVGRVPPVVG
jgi:hypothetical protein